MLEKDINDLLQDYKHRKNILEEITLSDIEKWNNIDVDVGWDDILNKPTTLEGYGITEELNSNYLNVVDNVIKNANILQWDSCVGGFISKKSSSYSEIKVDTTYDTYMSLSIHTLTHSDKKISIRNKGIELKAQGDDGVNLYNGTVLYTGFVDGDNYSQYYPIVQQDNDNLLFGSTKIPNKMNNTLKLPRVNLYNDSNVYEGSLENDTYNIKGVLHDGLRLRHADGKYLMIGHTDNEANKVYSYMICDVDGVLKNESDGDDWAPIRFEQDAFFRHGLRISSGEPLIINNYNVATKIANLEKAITTGTGMVEWSNVLNKKILTVTKLQSLWDSVEV